MKTTRFNLDDQRVLDRASTIISAKYPTGDILTSINSKEYFAMKLGKYEREVFAMVSLDSRKRILNYTELFFGTIDETAIFPREVAKQALLTNATGVIIAHNHPSFDTEPSEPDKRLTNTLKEMLEMLGIKLLDHVIVGSTKSFSFDENGILNGNCRTINPFDALMPNYFNWRDN